MRKHAFRNPSTSALVGGAMLLIGAWLLHDAYEARGRARPFVLRFLPAS